MGDRGIVLVKGNGDAPVCGVYVHWAGSRLPDLIAEAAGSMRGGDTSYAAARLVGILHERLDGPLGLGLIEPPADLEPGTLEEYSHGDAGVFVLDVDTGEVTNHGRGTIHPPFRVTLATA